MIKDIHVEKIFLFISLIFGFLYVFLLPPFQSVDEANHFYRAYEIVSGDLVAKKNNNEVGDFIPYSLQELSSKYVFLIKNIDAKTSPENIFNTSKIRLNPQKTKFIDFKNTALYSPICYLTQIPGMFITKKFNANPLVIFYAGRISNLLFFILFVYWSIKVIPFCKLTMMLIALMPMTLSLAASMSSDVIVISLNFFWTAYLLRLLIEEKKIDNKQIFILNLIVLFMVLSKHYFIFVPLVFLLPKSKFKNGYKYMLCIFSILIVAVVGMLFWQNAIKDLIFAMSPSADVNKQLEFILGNPISYSIILLKSFIVKLPRLIITMIGVLGWQDTRLDFLTYILYPVLSILSLSYAYKSEFKFKKWQNFVIGFTLLLSVFLIFTNLYLTWSDVASPIITGLNGKYFIPALIPFALLFYNHIKSKLPENAKLLIYVVLILILISSDLSLLHRFYTLTPNLYYKI